MAAAHQAHRRTESKGPSSQGARTHQKGLENLRPQRSDGESPAEIQRYPQGEATKPFHRFRANIKAKNASPPRPQKTKRSQRTGGTQKGGPGLKIRNQQPFEGVESQKVNVIIALWRSRPARLRPTRNKSNIVRVAADERGAKGCRGSTDAKI